MFAIVLATTLVITGTALALGDFDGGFFFMALMVTLLIVSFAAGVVARVAAGSFGLIAFVITSFAAGVLAWLNGGGLFVALSLLLTIFIARRALSGDARDGWLRRLTVEVVGARGTRFKNADLTNADLRDAHLGIVDFRGASLDGAKFDGATFGSGALFDPSAHPERHGKGPHPDGGTAAGRASSLRR
ncbi:MAG: pentapeptide repeat-containing protein [Chloroflexi bacterium]|nr:pentapeptide repeat-containing protein [Chloroflexota bacterium]